MKRALTRWLPATLFGRLALLLLVTALISHVLALTVLFEVLPHPAPPAHPGPTPVQAPAIGPLQPPPPGGPPNGQLHGPPHGPPPGWLLANWLDIGVRLSAVLLAAWVGARWLSGPLRTLASAASRWNDRRAGAALPERGPLELRQMTRAFNEMRGEIRRHLDNRDRFVAAVSHDLRTPLTRLRLRAESLPDAALRARFCHDVNEMESLVAATLDHLLGVADEEPLAAVDLGALLQTLVDEATECGQRAQWRGDSATVLARPVALRRCLGNLVGNAIRYGDIARIGCTVQGGHAVITIADDGPGLPEAELERVLLPFYRAEASRNRRLGGVGLGLTIAHDIALRHGARLQLANGIGRGLAVRLEWPLAPRR